MKRRLVKKWMNRYITPLVKDMPVTERYFKNHWDIVCIANGEVIEKGQAYKAMSDPLKAIKLQSKAIKELIDSNKGSHFQIRTKPEAFIHENIPYHKGPDYYPKNPRKRFTGVGVRILVQKKFQTWSYNFDYMFVEAE